MANERIEWAPALKLIAMLLCAITSRILLADTETERAERLADLAADWAAGGIDFIQIRERDLAHTELLQLSARVVQAVRQSGGATRVLVNGSPASACAIALQAGADGVHLPGGLDPKQLAAAAAQIRQAWQSHDKNSAVPAISVSCHTVEEIVAARAAEAALALFAPVFEKVLPAAPALAGQGITSLAEACAAARRPGLHPAIPVLALGGVTLENAPQCVTAGAAGIAAIRLFLLEERGGGPARREPPWRRLQAGGSGALRPEHRSGAGGRPGSSF